MKAEELKIGNFVTIDNENSWLNLKGKPLVVIGLSKVVDPIKSVAFPLSKYSVNLEGDNRMEYNQFDQFIEPIVVTENWLIKLGFTKDTETNYRWFLFDEALSYDVDDFCIRISDSWEFGKRKYVHELQNLIASLQDVGVRS
jgi:hypothetical protein